MKQQIIDTQKDKLLGIILSNKHWIKEFLKAKNFVDLCDMPFVFKLSIETQKTMFTARDFWKIMYGAHIRYNILLHSRHGSIAYSKKCKILWNEWIKEMKKFNSNKFNSQKLWDITDDHSSIKSFTKRFINSWIETIFSKKFNISKLDELVEKQEKNNKLSRSKLKSDNEEKYKGWEGIDNMEFRFNNAKILLNDILRAGRDDA